MVGPAGAGTRPSSPAPTCSRRARATRASRFNEPGLFLIATHVSVYYESLLSMPVGRPRPYDLLGGIDFWYENDYPARGEG